MSRVFRKRFSSLGSSGSEPSPRAATGSSATSPSASISSPQPFDSIEDKPEFLANLWNNVYASCRVVCGHRHIEGALQGFDRRAYASK